ncbi:hypothetical protein C9I47_0664 [Lysobacter maris]|nr:hypothetical protein C9I47_0664 [Lysobacter maris]
MAATPASADPCAATIESTDAMQYTVHELSVPASCKTFTVTLKHTGKLPKTVMGHNFVLGRSADIDAINRDGMAAGAANDYVKPADARVIASSKVIGGGETTTIAIPVARLDAGERYTYTCTFPGHSAVMRGSLALKP